MSQVYSDAQYGVEKILIFPSKNLTAATIGSITLTENIIVTEFGAFVTTALTGATTGGIQLRESAGVVSIAELVMTIPTDVGNTLRQTTMLNSSAADSGEVLLVTVITAGLTGVVVPYVKYKRRFVA